MSPEFIQCELCKAKIPLDSCKFATYRTVIDGKEYIFCCEKCAQRYQQKKKD